MGKMSLGDADVSTRPARDQRKEARTRDVKHVGDNSLVVDRAQARERSLDDPVVVPARADDGRLGLARVVLDCGQERTVDVSRQHVRIVS